LPYSENESRNFERKKKSAKFHDNEEEVVEVVGVVSARH
jgi:hypothetical protein